VSTTLASNQIFQALKLNPADIIKTGCILLDLGCGSRLDIRKGVQSLGGLYIGIDLCLAAPIKCDSHKLCLRTGTVDIVFSSATLEHFRNP
jgi:hypothetical protein